jgi:hypothetical protein
VPAVTFRCSPKIEMSGLATVTDRPVNYFDQFPQNRGVALASWSATARQERRLTCVHESAHIVGALLVGARPRVRLNTRRMSPAQAAFSASVMTRSSDADRDRDRDRGFIAAMGVVGERKYCLLNGLPEPSEESFQTDYGNLETGGLKQETSLECARLTLDQSNIWGSVLRLADEVELRWGVADELSISAADIAAIVNINAVRAMGA